jgi:hypothetical protein
VLPDLAVGVTTYLNIELVKLNTATWEQFPSGLLLALVEPVSERRCARTVVDGDRLAVEYEGSLENGTVFDSSRQRGAPFGPFVQGRGQIIRGYEVALAGRCLGERFKMIVPPHLAYGEAGMRGANHNTASKSVFRIRIGFGFNQVSGSGHGFGIRIRIQEGKNDPQKFKKLRNLNILKCWMFSFES